MGDIKINADRLIPNYKGIRVPDDDLALVRGAGGVHGLIRSLGGVPSDLGSASLDSTVKKEPELNVAKKTGDISKAFFMAVRKK